MKLQAVIGAVAILGACASMSGPVSTGPNTYMVAKSAPAASGGELKADLYLIARDFCAGHKRQVATVKADSRDAGFGRFGNAQLEFRCD